MERGRERKRGREKDTQKDTVDQILICSQLTINSHKDIDKYISLMRVKEL